MRVRSDGQAPPGRLAARTAGTPCPSWSPATAWWRLAEGWEAGRIALVTFGMLAASACGDPERPDFGSNALLPDTTPPAVIFVEPAEADSVFDTGSQIIVGVRIFDRSPIISVAASVLGLITFGFETLFPNDTIFEVVYPISTPLGPSGRVELRVVATDSAQNRSTARRSFVLQ